MNIFISTLYLFFHVKYVKSDIYKMFNYFVLPPAGLLAAKTTWRMQPAQVSLVVMVNYMFENEE